MSKELFSRITLVGMGPGDPGLVCARARQAISCAGILYGSPRMLQTAAQILGEAELAGKTLRNIYRRDAIVSEFSREPDSSAAAVLYSGSLSLSSGASSWKRDPVKRIPGISSADYFLDYLGLDRTEVCIFSAHGRQADALPAVLGNRRLLLLPGDRDSFRQLLLNLQNADPQIRLTLASSLSYPEERIKAGTLSDFLQESLPPLSLALFENDHPRMQDTGFDIPDEEFVRDIQEDGTRNPRPTPMTKQEVRDLALSLLHLSADSVLYDIGAGTGSVSVAASRILSRGTIVAVERNPDALSVLYRNLDRFGVRNTVVLAGTAPQCLAPDSADAGLPVPTHALIGGSGGNLAGIVRMLLERSPQIRVAITAVSGETIQEILQLAGQLETEGRFTVSMRDLSVTRYRKAGRVHIRTAQNPVLIAVIAPASV